jgi:GTPase
MFHDRARLTAVAGRGGDGSIHFRREKYVPRGGPDGGDGGDGGDVVLVADPRRRDLSGFRANQRLRAGRGGGGGGRLSNGARGDDAELRVPVGTQVFEGDELVADLAHAGARVVVAAGGVGGRGNKHFAGPSRQTPRFAEIGLPGEEREIELRLKLLADAALVGLPNAGKSLLLTRISNARPKVAEYPFTTLSPVLGTVEAPDGRQLVVADVPGLIEGASEGVGLGHEFLAHLERARVLMHVIDSSEDDADERWRTIDAELAAYGAGLDERPQIVVLNKIDLRPGARSVAGEAGDARSEDLGAPAFDIEDERIRSVLRVSAATGAGLDELRQALFELVPHDAEERGGGEVSGEPGRASPASPAALAAPEIVDFLVYRPQPARRPFRVYRTERGFRVTGKPPAEEQLEAILRAAGARAGDEVEVGEDLLEWE